MPRSFEDPFKKIVNSHGAELPQEIDLWAFPVMFHGEFRNIMWQWGRDTETGVFHWTFKIPALPTVTFSVPFDRLSLRAFANDIVRMLDATEKPEDTTAA